jgi:hypothetical protein
VESVVWLTAVRATVIVAAFVALAWALRRMRRESAEQFARLHSAQQQARAEVQALSERITALATLVAAFPARVVERPVETPAPPMPRREASPVRSYETAHRLARSGATVEEIMATCGMAGTEARLLRRLHGAAASRENAA